MSTTTEQVDAAVQAEQGPEESVIEVRSLSKSFGRNKVLDGFDLDLYRGESCMVLGRSGSGKSVLIKCIVRLLAPDKGSIKVLGEDVLSLEHDALDRLRVKVGFLFQSSALYDSMTVRENLEFPLRRHWIATGPGEREALVKEALESVDLVKTAEQYPSELSGGMRRRIGLARTLIMKPEIVLYDEPTAGLDAVTGKEIMDLISSLQEKYTTSSLIISHDLNIGRLAADRIVVLVDGKAHAMGSYDELRGSDDPKVKQFFIFT
jgi:phospholipid/cholesterol/gamma-HCH transport system ATP-binding protein